MLKGKLAKMNKKELVEIAAIIAAKMSEQIEKNFQIIPTLTLAQAAEAVGVCEEKMRLLCTSGAIPFIKIDRLYRIKPADLNAYLESNYNRLENLKNNKKRTSGAGVGFSCMLPDHLQHHQVISKWQEWEEFRRKKGKPISEIAAKRQIKMLKELSALEIIEVIDNSIANDYQGLFPPKGRKVNQPPKNYAKI